MGLTDTFPADRVVHVVMTGDGDGTVDDRSPHRSANEVVTVSKVLKGSGIVEVMDAWPEPISRDSGTVALVVSVVGIIWDI